MTRLCKHWCRFDRTRLWVLCPCYVRAMSVLCPCYVRTPRYVRVRLCSSVRTLLCPRLRRVRPRPTAAPPPRGSHAPAFLPPEAAGSRPRRPTPRGHRQQTHPAHAPPMARPGLCHCGASALSSRHPSRLEWWPAAPCRHGACLVLSAHTYCRLRLPPSCALLHP